MPVYTRRVASNVMRRPVCSGAPMAQWPNHALRWTRVTTCAQNAHCANSASAYRACRFAVYQRLSPAANILRRG